MTPALVTDDEIFQCDLHGPVIRCEIERMQKEIIIPINDLICILPRGNRHVLLFLRKDEKGRETSDESMSLHTIQILSLPEQLSRFRCEGVPTYLGTSSREKVERLNIHVIISSNSGTGTGKSVFEKIVRPFLSQIGVSEYAVHETQSSQTIIKLCRERLIPHAQAGIKQTVILLSGDGGLTDIIDSFHGTAMQYFIKPNIALIPTGTGNAMANSIGLLARRTTGLLTLLQGRPNPIPAFLATFSPGSELVMGAGSKKENFSFLSRSQSDHLTVYGSVVASWGMHATLVADSDTAEYRKFGAERFQMAAKEILFPSNGCQAHKFRGLISFTWFDKETGERRTDALPHEEHMYVVATLVSSLERGFTISPSSTPLDGCLRIIHFGPMASEQVLNLLSAAYRGGKHTDDPRVTYREVESFRISFDEVDERWRRVCIDGKIIAVGHGGWLNVQKASEHRLNVLLPSHIDV
ncbi:diacylglycerol/lipid kinase family protein [Aspergillus saccharolyticus JOP 1030-1]|uniref:DAGKc domain-containing protein n=1 Tax=Aspergillus saccharolyticus JOP 1030-1 TaxID=1450539 RepID=A0A319A9C7_9EURO|nr:hypothetical protein BP01DRAFT_354166 [Aspergillus saccharolyticus JOP 1030-1]PYH48308.1 hypothetical protein BP01DRAFT_354166 [Aspergillus saccharolyticus JOP 1030-1]